MKNHRSFNIALGILILLNIASAVEQGSNKSTSRYAKVAVDSILTVLTPTIKALTINNIVQWVQSDGLYPRRSLQGTTATFPKDTGGIIWAEGLVWGAMVRDGYDPLIRVNGYTFETGIKAGKIVFDVAGKVTGSEDPALRHLWRVRPDYKTADLTEDARYSFLLDMAEVTDDHVQALYEQYDYDWQNWPAAEGAPYEDIDGDGSYDPAVDIPGYPGAAQTIWLVAKDLPDQDGNDISLPFYGAPSIGIELQLTIWAFNYRDGQWFNDAIFKRARIIYTGGVETPDSARLDSMYIGFWSDPDLGDAGDDYVGCDTTLSLGYVYNGNAIDVTYDGIFGLPVPAAGYALLQGPYDNGDYLGLNAFSFCGPGAVPCEPDIGVYAGTLQYWNILEGFLPYPPHPSKVPWKDHNGNSTKFIYAGDPVAGTGHIDGVAFPPGDRIMVMSTGPFAMALGDTQEITYALIGAMAEDNMSSLVKLRQTTGGWQSLYVGDLAIDERTILTTGFNLAQNYPNPFNPTTVLRFDLPMATHAKLIVYDVLGREVAILKDEQLAQGMHQAMWNGRDKDGSTLASGIYFARLVTPEYSKTIKMLLLK
ncbi:T9SS type A sorting domain-containing protein [Candidatus Neomarinimicrobiota bacterium]